MNREIVELREVITKLVPLLTGKGLTVTQRGSQAYVKTDPRTLKPVSVNIPNISDNATPEFLRAIQGFIDHEVAHVLFTDWKYYGRAPDEKQLRDPKVKRFMNIHNMVEDTMIEKEILKVFPGSSRNLSEVRNYFLSKITTPALAAAKSDKEKFQYLLVPALRALAGHSEFQDFMDENDYWSFPPMKAFVDALSPKALGLLKTATTTKETLEVAEELEIVLHPPQPEMPSMPSPDCEDGDDSEDGESQDKPDKKAGKGNGDGERDHEDSEPGEGEDDPDENGDGEDGEEDDGDDGDEEDDKDAKDGKKPEKDDEKSEDDEGAGGDEGEDGTPDDDDDEEDGTSNDEDGDEQPIDFNGSEQNSDVIPDGLDGGGVGDIEVGSNHDADEDESSAGGGVGNGAAKSMFDFEDDAFNEADMSSQISILISDAAVEAMNEADYNVFTRELDRIEPLNVPGNINSKWVPEMEESVRSMTGRMQKDIERMLASQSHVIRTPGHKNGKLHSPSLFRVSQGDARVFSQKQEHRSKDTAVTLLIDNSGSMHGPKMELAMLSGYALSSTLDRVSIAHEVLGFTTGDYYGVPNSLMEAMRKDAVNSGIKYDRVEPIIMPIYKEFDERITAVVKQRMAYAKNAQRGLNGNIDGESLEYAASRLIKRREKRKVMLVLSDGQPAGSSRAGPHLSTIVQKLGKMGIECIGIGIMSHAVARYYPQYVVLNDVNQLPGEVMSALKKILT